MKKLIIASHNEGKVSEIRQMLSSFGVEVFSATDLNLPDVEETGNTFAENAILKAEALSKESGLPCLADDSGLCVSALGGRPGVFSARYAPDRDFNKGMDLLLKEIEATGVDDRSAYFSCVLALAQPEQETEIFEGRVDGFISLEKSGTGGFGYDPLFIPLGFEKTLGHFSPAEKAKISHRGKALEKFIAKHFLR